MTITFIAPSGVELSAQRWRQGHAAQYGGGANRPLGGRSGFRVDTAPDVFTATSTTWTLKPCSAMIDPGAATHQGMYGWATDANVTGSMTPADSAIQRQDRVWILVNDSTSGDGSGAVSAEVVYQAGTPGSGAPDLPARAFLVADITVPPAGGGSPTVLVNPARFAAAGAPLPVYSQYEMESLSTYNGLMVQRRDLAGRPIYTYNGTAWRAPIEAAAVVVDGEWSATGQVTRALSPDGQSMVTIGERMARIGAGFAMDTTYRVILAGFIPVGFRPSAMFNGWALLTASNDGPRAQIWWRVNTAGTLEARLDSGTATLNTGDRLHLSGNWTTA